MANENDDKMSLELYSDQAVIRLTQANTDISVHLIPCMAARLGATLAKWAADDRSGFTPFPTPPQPAKGGEEKA